MLEEIDYQIYQNDLLHLTELDDSANAHAKAAESLLRTQGWTWENVTDVLTSPLLERDSEGWLIQQPHFAQNLEYAELAGFTINFESSPPSFRLLVRKADRSHLGLFSQSDVAEAVRISREDPSPPFFCLDAPSVHERYHPFQKLRFHPENIEGGGLLQAMFEADYLMKSFSVGADVSAKPPFKQRPTLTGDGEGLLDKLPRTLKSVLRPVHERKASKSDSGAHRFWIQADELVYEEKSSPRKDEVAFYFKQPKMAIRTSPMFHDINGTLVDAAGMDPDSPEVEFSKDMTANYDEIGQNFPIFLRLREMVKLTFFGRVLYSYLSGIRKQETNPTVDENFVAGRYREMWQSIRDTVEDALRKQRDDINSKGGLSRFVEGTFGDIVDQIRDLCDSYVSSLKLKRLVSRYLDSYRGSARELADFVASTKISKETIRSRILKQKMEHYHQTRICLENALDGIIRNGNSTEFCWRRSSSATPCLWAPAALNKFNPGYNVYGGVILAPKCTPGRVAISKFSLAVRLTGINQFRQTRPLRAAESQFSAGSASAVPVNKRASAPQSSPPSEGGQGGQNSNQCGSGGGGSNGGTSGNGGNGEDGRSGGNGGRKGKNSSGLRIRSKTRGSLNLFQNRQFTTDILKPLSQKTKDEAKRSDVDSHTNRKFGDVESKKIHADHFVSKYEVISCVNRAVSNKEFRRMGPQRKKVFLDFIGDVLNRPFNIVPTLDKANWAKADISRFAVESLKSGNRFDAGKAKSNFVANGGDFRRFVCGWTERFFVIEKMFREELPLIGRVYAEAGEIVLANLLLFGMMYKGVD